MELKLIKKTVNDICFAISTVLNVDVIVVDHNYDIISSTYKYLGKYDIGVHDESVIARCIQKNKTSVYSDTNENPECTSCLNKKICKIKGMICVPISCNQQCVGAIEIMMIKEQNGITINNNLQEVTTFLECMAELIGSKLKSVEQYKAIEFANLEIASIIENSQDAIVFFDDNDQVVYSNKLFRTKMQLPEDIHQQKATSIFDHKEIRHFLLKRKSIKNRLMIFKNLEIDFQAIVNCVGITFNGEYMGSLISFRIVDNDILALRQLLQDKSTIQFADLLMRNNGLEPIIKKAKEYAISKDIILIDGGKGVGKKDLAKCIHNFSDCQHNALVMFNCSGSSREYYLAKLFGFNENYFGLGQIQLAAKGTLVINDIEKMPLNVQVDLYRLLTSKELEFERGYVLKLNKLRLIVTTHADLAKRVNRKEFLEELYYLIKQNHLHIPSINEQESSEKIKLINFHAKRYAQILEKNFAYLEDDALNVIANIKWYKNMTGLESFMESLIYYSKQPIITAEMVNELIDQKQYMRDIKLKSIEQLEREAIIAAVEYYREDKKYIELITNKLGISRATLYRKLNYYKIKI